ncbi:PilZ domain-containing protein [Neptunomonas qingdaonensis]|uniref:Cyclic diguanosine monophosphate-binding protein n=1 Tax=Neptunomonas qingdaonensis TaxID=1045558 RepID=A0A1I2M5W7_9GAMM|nr:PilZ domain-containing protein [Neptunomonas qingdaonensis]SFF86884.1 PilZ domain-containing protein [Neptunomonas qingdaonensis]
MDNPTLAQQNRRRFTRINFDAQCTLSSAENEWKVTLIDICLKGALIESHHDIVLSVSDQVALKIMLEGSDIVITMPARINHQLKHRFGFQAMSMELDDISHLRRLVELNLGDSVLLERELVQLYNT